MMMVITILMMVILVLMLLVSHKKEKKETEELFMLAQVEKEEREAQRKIEEDEAAEFALKEQTDSFYQKLQDGFDVNILIVGDSIGAQAGKSDHGRGWADLLGSYLESVYDIKVNVTNVSMGGNVSYAGYVRVMKSSLLSEGYADYDLAIVCYGQNDKEDNFSLYYEALIRAIRSQYNQCSIISILESSQREYTEKMKIIQDICAHYEIPVADTIAPFNVNEEIYSNLTDDGVHPNDAGQKVYYETVKSVIEKHLGENADRKEIKAINDMAEEFNSFLWIEPSSGWVNNGTSDFSGAGFTRVDDLTFCVTVNELGLDSISGIFGVDYTYQSGENKVVIYIDGKEYAVLQVTFNHDFSQRRILAVGEECHVYSDIRIVFETKEQADGFSGICFSNSSGFS